MNEKIKKAIEDLDRGNYINAIDILWDNKIISDKEYFDILHCESYCEPDISKLRELIYGLPIVQ